MTRYEDMKKMLAVVDDPVMRLEMVMDFGAHLDAVPESAQCHEIDGCASHVEICRCGNNFYATADSAIVRGIAAIMVAMVDGHTAEEIRAMDIAGEFAGLHLNLGAGRLNGVNSMIRFLQNL